MHSNTYAENRLGISRESLQHIAVLVGQLLVKPDSLRPEKTLIAKSVNPHSDAYSRYWSGINQSEFLCVVEKLNSFRWYRRHLSSAKRTFSGSRQTICGSNPEFSHKGKFICGNPDFLARGKLICGNGDFLNCGKLICGNNPGCALAVPTSHFCPLHFWVTAKMRLITRNNQRLPWKSGKRGELTPGRAGAGRWAEALWRYAQNMYTQNAQFMTICAVCTFCTFYNFCTFCTFCTFCAVCTLCTSYRELMKICRVGQSLQCKVMFGQGLLYNCSLINWLLL